MKTAKTNKVSGAVLKVIKQNTSKYSYFEFTCKKTTFYLLLSIPVMTPILFYESIDKWGSEGTKNLYFQEKHVRHKVSFHTKNLYATKNRISSIIQHPFYFYEVYSWMVLA